jgi:hypothetical protein
MTNGNLDTLSLFGDDVFSSTDLNRRPGEILNHAREAPVTISRNNEQFALLRREQVAALVNSLNRVQAALLVLVGADAAISGRDLPPSVAWLRAYDNDDLQRLRSEVLNTTAQVAFGNGDWNQVDAVIHEWRESALVAQSGLLDSMLSADDAAETPLPSPDEILRLVTPA